MTNDFFYISQIVFYYVQLLMERNRKFGTVIVDGHMTISLIDLI